MSRTIEVPLRTLHPMQDKVMAEKKRFNVLKMGRRWGKTTLATELLLDKALDGLPVGYWSPTYKDLHEIWNELKSMTYDITRTKYEQVKQIVLITGGIIDFWSLEDGNSGRGRKYARAIIDEAEKAPKFKDAWEQAIFPTLTDFGGDAWFLSTPKGANTYFNTLYERYLKDEQWMSWNFPTISNPFILPKEIEEARNQLDDFIFRQEYLGESLSMVNNPFAYAFDINKHVGKCEYEPHHPLYLSFDFNVDPMTCIAVQNHAGIRVVNEFRIKNSDIYEMCDRIKAAYPFAVLFVTGDATGANRAAISKGNINYYTVIRQHLGLNAPQMKTPSVNPAVSDTRVLLNAILQNGNLLVDKEKCPYLVKDLLYVQVDGQGDIIKDRRSDTREADLLDCFVGETQIKTWPWGSRRIDDLKIGDKVLTRNGRREVIDTWYSVAEVYEFEFSDGSKIQCTKDHKFYVDGVGWFEIFNIFEQNIHLCKYRKKENLLNIMVSGISSMTNRNITTVQDQESNTADAFTGRCGLMSMGRFLRHISFTIRMVMHSITPSKILNWLTGLSTSPITCMHGLRGTLQSLKQIFSMHVHLQTNGMVALPVLSGIKSMQKISTLDTSHLDQPHALFAKIHLPKRQSRHDSVQTTVSHSIDAISEQTTLKKNVRYAAENSLQENTLKHNHAPLHAGRSFVHVVGMRPMGKKRVYDITVKDEHEFIANGFVVHNCIRYYLHTFHKQFIKIRS